MSVISNDCSDLREPFYVEQKKGYFFDFFYEEIALATQCSIFRKSFNFRYLYSFVIVLGTCSLKCPL